MNELTKKENKGIMSFLPEEKSFFTIKEGNYKITQINRKEHIVELEQFKKIMPMLNNKDVLFISINDKIVNKNRIEDIEPTREKTVEQLKQYEQKQKEIKALEDEVEEINRAYREYESDYFDAMFGKNKWSKFPSMYGAKAKMQVPVDEVLKCKKQWESENQEQVQRFNEIIKLLEKYNELQSMD